MAADAGLAAKVEALRVPILAAACARADAADPTQRRLAQARIAETEVARCRSMAAALYVALEADGHVAGDVPDGIAPPDPAASPIDG